MKSYSGSEKLIVAAGVALFLLASNCVYLGHYVDDIVWVLLSRSFLRGSIQAAWSYFPHVETSATWGFAILLMPIAALAGKSAVGLKLGAAVMAAGGTALFYDATRDWFSAQGRLLYAAALFCDGFSLGFSGTVMSEAGYLLVFGAALRCAIARGWLNKPSPRRLAFLGVLTSLLVVTRVIGAAFFAAAALELSASRRWRELLRYGAAFALGVLPFFLVSKISSGAFSYHSGGWGLLLQTGPGAVARMFATNAYFYLKGLALLTVVYFPAFLPNSLWLKLPALTVVLVVAGVGAARRAKTCEGRFLLAYAAVYGLVCVAWPFQAPRFVVPIYPVFLLFFLSGFAELIPRRLERRLWAALALLSLGSNASEVAGTLRTSLTQAPDIPHQSYLWLREHSSPSDLIVSMDIARINYYAQRRGIHFIPSDSLEAFVSGSRRLGARYFVDRAAGYVGLSLGTPDPITAQHDRLTEYLGHAEFFTPVHENREEGVRIFVPRR